MPKFTIGGAKDMPKVLGLFNDQEAAKSAISSIKDLGISEDKISLVAKNGEDQDIEAGAEMGAEGQNLVDGTTTGGAIGGVAGVLASAGLLAIPGLGPVLAAGPIAAGLTGAAAGGVTGGLVDYGIDQQEGERYAGEVEGGNILVAVEDTEQEKINDVAAKLKDAGSYDVATH
ncbi:general stress protein [Orenia marismortui]|uniref:general stress protein n=1 Tax=Orenia marismortui TaxID=46469 RepID=UPI000367422E|nr:general stress protein [Orenia marismortui]